MGCNSPQWQACQLRQLVYNTVAVCAGAWIWCQWTLPSFLLLSITICKLMVHLPEGIWLWCQRRVPVSVHEGHQHPGGRGHQVCASALALHALHGRGCLQLRTQRPGSGLWLDIQLIGLGLEHNSKPSPQAAACDTARLSSSLVLQNCLIMRCHKAL